MDLDGPIMVRLICPRSLGRHVSLREQYGSRLKDLEDSQPALPFTGLRLPLESKVSNFGRPPQANLPQLYPPTTSSPTTSSSSSRSRYLIATVHDPFFLPPPFIPSHPHLKDLCTDAVSFLQQTHDKYEAEVLEFVAQKAGELRILEDKVRCEVEMLWNMFLENDEEARAGSMSRRGSRVNSRSKSREPVRRFSPSPAARTRVRPTGSSTTSTNASASATPSTSAPSTQGPATSQSQTENPNPILNEAARNPAYAPGASLLSASMSANAYHQQTREPEVVGDVADDSIARVSQNYGTNDDARAVAMSHVFSVLDDAMASKKPRRRSRSRSTGAGSVPTSATLKTTDESAGVQGQSIHGKDSWIDHERLVSKGVGKEPTIQEESTGNSRQHTPKPTGASGKESKRTVTFEDQKGIAPESSTNGHVDETQNRDASPEGSDREDGESSSSWSLRKIFRVLADHTDHVFDLEMEGDGSASASASAAAAPPQPTESDRPVDPFEQEISARYAAHAPSHRSAWKRPENGQAGYSWYRKGDNTLTRGRDSTQLDDGEQARISGLATSMPVHIALPKLRKPSGLGLERKTSLSEKEGNLVPPLMAAMKQRGLDVPRQPSQGQASGSGRGQGDGQVEGGRRVSATVGTMDPGVLHDLESLDINGDDDDDEEEDDGDDDTEGEEGDQQGTLRQSGFVPPHVLARNRQTKGVEGVRSIYDK